MGTTSTKPKEAHAAPAEKPHSKSNPISIKKAPEIPKPNPGKLPKTPWGPIDGF